MSKIQDNRTWPSPEAYDAFTRTLRDSSLQWEIHVCWINETFIELPFWAYHCAGPWNNSLNTYFSFFFSCFLRSGDSPNLFTTFPGLYFQAFGHILLFQFSLIQKRWYFQHHFNRWYKKIIQGSWISFPKSQNLLAAEWMKNAGRRAYLVVQW